MKNKTLLILTLSISTLMLPRMVQSQNLDGYNEMIENLVQDGVPYITPDNLVEKIKTDKNIYLLDTRETSEYLTSHIANAVHVGYESFKLKKLKDIPKDATIVTYCSVGYRSGQIGLRLLKKGYTHVFNLEGGLFSWANNEYPMENANGEPTKDIHGYDAEWGKWVNTNKCSLKLDE